MLSRKYIKNVLRFFLILIFVLSCQTVSDKDKDISDISEPQIEVEVEEEEEEEELPVEIIEPEPAVEMVYFEGRLLNIFFHPVIYRPEIAFNGSRRAHFLLWFVTADEYRKILYELYMADFVLVDINEYYEVVYEDDAKKLIEKKILVPEGKKPMILSVDDLSYYTYMKAGGVVHKLVLDDNNELAAWTPNDEDGELSYDNDVITILEDFIKQHPDFSLRGARGIIALTGFEGVFGYNTHRSEDPENQDPENQDLEYQEEVEKAVLIANKLKELGWRFASHSFDHDNLPRITYESLVADTDRWDLEVRPIVGDTDLYVYPYGAGVEYSNAKHTVLRDRGFNLFFGVGPGYFYRNASEYMYFNRYNIDGTYFRDFRNHRDRLFEMDKVIDSQWRNARR